MRGPTETSRRRKQQRNHGRAVRRWVPCLALGVLAVASAGCRTGRFVDSRDTHVHQGEILHGRVPHNRDRQVFTFDAVGPCLLDFTVRSDRANMAAPKVRVLDPAGEALPVKKAITSPHGAASLKVEDLVLVRSGTYRVEALPWKGADRRGHYTFWHQLHYPGPAPRLMRLSSQPQPVEFVAPRYGRVVASIRPRCRMHPDVFAVYDPQGGPALDPSRVPPGAPRPLVDRRRDGTMVLAFTAPASGRYRLMAGARGCGGMGEVRVTIRSTPNECRHVIHDRGPLDAAPATPHVGRPAPPVAGPGSPVVSMPAPVPVPTPVPQEPGLLDYPDPTQMPGAPPPLGIHP